jgi:hypothetical protein
MPEQQIAGFPDVRHVGIPTYRELGDPICRDTGMSECRLADLPRYLPQVHKISRHHRKAGVS